jgi:hypothetical protein
MLSMMPLAGVGLLSACGEKAPPTASAPAPAPSPAAPPPPATTAPTAVAPAPSAPSPAPAPAVVGTGEQIASTLGYVTDATQVDTTKYPTYVAGSNCSQCAQYSGADGAAEGPCVIFSGRLVSAKGWCSAWAKRA